MRKLFICSILAITALCISCSRDEANLFDQSVAERTQTAMSNASDILTSATNGWEMIVFPTTTTKGYNMIVKFNKNGTCVCAAKNETTTFGAFKTDSTGMWQMIPNEGPCLSFDTYNTILHAFSDPILPGQTKGVGMKGDFEFLILKATAGEVVLKGKKRATYNLLRPLPENQNWETYFDEVASKVGNTFTNNNIMTAQVGDKKYTLYNGATGVFKMMDFGMPLVDTLATSYPFAFTQKGICLMQGFYGKTDIRVLDLMDDRFAQGDVIVSTGVLSEYLLNYCKAGYGWKMLGKNMPASWASLMTAVKDELYAITGNKKDAVQAINLGYKTSKIVKNQRISIHNFVIQLDYYLEGASQTPVDFTFSAETDEDKVTLTYIHPTDESAVAFLQSIPSAEALVKAVAGTYMVTSDNKMNPTFGMKLTQLVSEETATISYTIIK